MAAAVALDAAAFNCERCRWGRHCDSSRPAPTKLWRLTHAGEVVAELDTCPKPLASPDSAVMLEMYPHWQAGRLPMAGGFLAQPRAYLEAMKLLDAVVAEERERRESRQNR